jgi:hypothetical protein
MAENFPGPYEVRLFYTVNVLAHEQRLNVRMDGDPVPGDGFDGMSSLRRDDTPFLLSDEVDDWITLLQPLFSAAVTTFDYAELWKYVPNSYEATYVATYDISLPGTSGTGSFSAGQCIYVMRTAEGGIMKVSLLEAIRSQGNPLPYATLTAGEKALVDAVVGGTVPWLARDTSYPIAFKAMFPGQNEAVFKKRFNRG